MPKKPITQSFFFALGEGAYIALVALFIQSAAKIVPKDPSILGFTLFLTVFVFSAAVSSALVLGRPVLLYLDGKKKEAVEFFILTLGWLFVFLLAVFAIIALGSS